jgi:predicted cation transporter
LYFEVKSKAFKPFVNRYQINLMAERSYVLSIELKIITDKMDIYKKQIRQRLTIMQIKSRIKFLLITRRN